MDKVWRLCMAIPADIDGKRLVIVNAIRWHVKPFHFEPSRMPQALQRQLLRSGLLDKFKHTAAMLAASGFEVRSSFLEGNIFNSLMAYKAENAVGMLVMGAFSHSKLAYAFLGSNTLKMIESTHLPLVILR